MENTVIFCNFEACEYSAKRRMTLNTVQYYVICYNVHGRK